MYDPKNCCEISAEKKYFNNYDIRTLYYYNEYYIFE